MLPIKLVGVLEITGSFQINITANPKYNSGHSVSIGFILVSIATSLPEMFVGVMSALSGIPEFAFSRKSFITGEVI